MLGGPKKTEPAAMPIDAPDLAADAIESPRARALLDWWNAARGVRAMPAREDFHAEDLAPWWADLILYEVETAPDGTRLFRFRVHGTNAIQADGANHTGRHLAEVIPPAYRDTTLDCYEAAAERGRPLYSRGHRIMRSGVRMNFERLLLPLGKGKITHILSLLLWRLPSSAREIDALTAENLPFALDLLGFVVP